MYNSKELQAQIIHLIQQHTGRSKSKKEKLSEQLGISLPVLYKRLNGKSQFSIAEVATLMRLYNFGFDDLTSEKKRYAKIYFDHPENTIYSVEDFLNRLSHLIRSFKNDEETTIRYVSSEVPLFYYFQKPMLGCLKLYLFARLVWKLPAFQLPNQFSMSLFSPSVIKQMDQLWAAYSQLNTIEIWHPTMWHNTLNQIVYLVEEDGVYNRSDIPQILHEIEIATTRMKEMAFQRTKDYSDRGEGSIQVFGNNLLHTNNVILAARPQQQRLFITHDNPNYLFTEDRDLIQRSRKWMDLLEENSKPLEQPAEIRHFFEQFELKLQRIKDKLGV